jgi:tetratricopeptide (TPR) repeat protein
MKSLTRISVFTVTILCWIGLVPTAHAFNGEDDGARSILADGAGNRALALGGAYVAIADDASAAVWNPGGLGWIQRREFQATHTNLIGLGFNEQYASFVLPSWRWGVGSLTFRRFGVDGIEQRDDRNLLLADDLAYSETEFTAAYGREFGPALSVGGGLKLRRHCLGEFNDSGLGLDLGLIVKPALAVGNHHAWAENFTVGISARNAVEPSLRLDQESVPDPNGIRLGTAYKHPLGRQGWILGTMDLEKTREMNSHLHSGVELCLVPALALRAGVNRGVFVAGMGVLWQDIGVDYIYENLTDNPIHRFGISFRFGPRRQDARLAARAAAERDLQQRLAGEFARRNEDRKNDLLRRAQASLDLGHVAEADELVAMVLVIDPDNEKARELRASILLSDAKTRQEAGDFSGATVVLSRLLELRPGDSQATLMLARIRAASDSRTARTREIRSLLDRAMDDFAAGELLAAQSGFARVLELDAGDTEARAMAERTARVVANRVDDLLEQARTLGNTERFNEARAKLDAGRALDPNAAEIAALSARLDRWETESQARARQQQSVEQAAAESVGTGAPEATQPVISNDPAGPEPISESQKREMAEMYGRGMAAMENGSPDQAVHFFELVWSIDPTYQQAGEYLKQYYLTQGMEAFVAGQLQAAVRNWESAVRVAPEDSKAQGYLRRAQDQLKHLERLAG